MASPVSLTACGCSFLVALNTALFFVILTLLSAFCSADPQPHAGWSSSSLAWVLLCHRPAAALWVLTQDMGLCLLLWITAANSMDQAMDVPRRSAPCRAVPTTGHPTWVTGTGATPQVSASPGAHPGRGCSPPSHTRSIATHSLDLTWGGYLQQHHKAPPLPEGCTYPRPGDAPQRPPHSHSALCFALCTTLILCSPRMRLAAPAALGAECLAMGPPVTAGCICRGTQE